eukprot:5717051-Amphidinium_carterae.1
MIATVITSLADDSKNPDHPQQPDTRMYLLLPLPNHFLVLVISSIRVLNRCLSCSLQHMFRLFGPPVKHSAGRDK